MRRIAAIGMFDGVHRGHQFLLECLLKEGRRRGLAPAVITFDSHPMELVNPRLAPAMLMDNDRKLEAIRRCGVEDIILLHFDDALRSLTAKEFMEMMHVEYDVDCLLVGYDHRFGRNRSEGFDDYVAFGKEIGMEVLKAPESPGASSSLVRELLANGDVGEAAVVLGYPYSISGTVVEGRQLGRKLGFPTANLRLSDHRRLVPLAGVYAADVKADIWESPRRAMLNIGHRPTVDKSNAPLTIEVHVIDYDGDLYGHRIEVRFLCRLRDEKTFGSLAELQSQLEIDRRAASSI